MNNEKLKIALCGYLPYGVKVSCENSLGENEPHELLSIEREKLTIRKKSFPYRTYLKLSEGLPYLFPISSLTKPIQLSDYNNGNPFVPIVEMRRIGIYDYLDYITNEAEDLIKKRGYDNWVGEIPLKIIDLLNRWKIDYRGLINECLAIEVNESNNPYL